MRRTVPPSAEIEEQVDQLLAVGVGENPRESLSELARLGARLIIQRAVEDEFDAWLGRSRHERRPDAVDGRPELIARPSQSSPGLSGSAAARSQAESWYRIIAIIVGSATSVPEITAAASE